MKRQSAPYVDAVPQKIYEGKITLRDDQVVTVNGQPLSWALEVKCHSPTGLSWGYGGAGPAQLAIALLADAFGPDVAIRHAWLLLELVQNKLEVGKPWVLTEHDLRFEFLHQRTTNASDKSRAAHDEIEGFFSR